MAQYARISMAEAYELPCDMFLLYHKNWTVDRLMQTEEGRKYLEDVERYKKTKLDRAGLQGLKRRLTKG